MYSLKQIHFVVAHAKDNTQAPPQIKNKPEGIQEGPDRIQEEHINTRIDLLGNLIGSKGPMKQMVGGELHGLRQLLAPKEPLVLSEERLRDYAGKTLEKIVKIDDQEKAINFLDQELRGIERDPLITEISKHKKRAIVKTLRIAVGDDIFFSYFKAKVSQIWKSVTGDGDFQSYEGFIRAVRMGIENSIKSGVPQVIKLDQELGGLYTVKSLTAFGKEIREDVNKTDVGPFRAILNSGPSWKQTLLEAVANDKDTLGKIGLYLQGRGWKSRLISQLPDNRTQHEVRQFFMENAESYAKKRDTIIALTKQSLFKKENLETNFDAFGAELRKLNIPNLQKINALSEYPPRTEKLWNELLTLNPRITSGDMYRAMTAFDRDISELVKKTTQTRKESMKSQAEFHIGKFLTGIETNQDIVRSLGNLHYGDTVSPSQAKEYLTKLLSNPPTKFKNPVDQIRYRDIVTMLQSVVDNYTAQLAGGKARVLKEFARQEQEKKPGGLSRKLTSKEEELTQAAGDANASREEVKFGIENVNKNTTTELKKLGYTSLDTLLQSPAKLNSVIEQLKKIQNLTYEQQRLLATLMALQENEKDYRSSVVRIVQNSPGQSIKEAQRIINVATGGSYTPTEREIKSAIYTHTFIDERNLLWTREERLISMKAGDSTEAKYVYAPLRGEKSSVLNYIVEVKDEFDCSIKNPGTGRTILSDVPKWAVQSVMSEIDLFHSTGLSFLESEIPFINNEISKRIGKRVDSYDGQFDRYDTTRILSILANILYGPDPDIPESEDTATLKRFFTLKQNQKITMRPREVLLAKGIINQDNVLLRETFKALLMKQDLTKYRDQTVE